MTLTELRYVLAVAQLKHFGKAAKHCHVSQPTLSVAISKLEKRLNVSLFERSRGDIRITGIGVLVVAQAQRVIEEADKLCDLVDCSRGQLDSPLKLGGIFTVAPYLFPSLITQLNRVAPDMPLVINENFTANLREKLSNGELDAIFIALPFTEPSVVVKPLYEESFVVLMPKAHRLAKKTAISEADLSKENVLMLGEGHCFRDQVLEACPACYQSGELQQVVECTSLETLRHMVASGMGITVLPCTATQVKHYDKLLCVKPFKLNAPRRTIALAWRASFPRTKAIDALISALAKAKISNICLIL